MLGATMPNTRNLLLSLTLTGGRARPVVFYPKPKNAFQFQNWPAIHLAAFWKQLTAGGLQKNADLRESQKSEMASWCDTSLLW